MTLMDIAFDVFHENSDVPETIRRCTGWTCVPRIGEYVRLKGPEFGDEYHAWMDDGVPVGEAIFRVKEITWEEDGSSCTIFLQEPARVRPGMSLWCACSKEVRAGSPPVGEDNRCVHCSRKRRTAQMTASWSITTSFPVPSDVTSRG